MMKRYVILGTLLMAYCVPASSQAAILNRHEYLMAAGACQPFVPTSAVRYNASGISNVGSTPIYVVCSLRGTSPSDDNNLTGVTGMSLVILNSSATAQTTNCTARPGSVVGHVSDQLAAPGSMTMSPSDHRLFSWSMNSFFEKDAPVHPVGNVNFTCVLNPGHSLQRLEVLYTELI